MTPLNHSFQNFQNRKPFRNRLNRYRDPNMTQHEHVYAICSRQEIVDDVISGEDVDLWVTSFRSCREIRN